MHAGFSFDHSNIHSWSLEYYPEKIHQDYCLLIVWERKEKVNIIRYCLKFIKENCISLLRLSDDILDFILSIHIKIPTINPVNLSFNFVMIQFSTDVTDDNENPLTDFVVYSKVDWRNSHLQLAMTCLLVI